MKEMRFKIGKFKLKLSQSTIDVALWIVTEDDGEEFDHKKVPQGYLLTYVGYFLLIGSKDVRNAIEEDISRIWKIKVTGDVSQFDIQNTEGSLTFLSTTVRSHLREGGFTMTQEEFIRDVLKTWEMSDCRPLKTPGDPTSVQLPEEGKTEGRNPEGIWRAQK